MGTPITFGAWLPDLPPFNNGGLITCTNVIPAQQSYLPFPKLLTFSQPLQSRCQGAILATDPSGNPYNFAGDQSHLYALAAQTYVDVTRVSGGYNTGIEDYWEFVNWGNTIIGVNGFNDTMQQISLGAANFIDLSSGVRAKHMAVMRDFVVVGNVNDSAIASYRVRWCAINNPTSWTPDAATLADFQDLPSEGGPIQKVLGGEYGVILQQRSVWRMLFVGSPLVFQFDRIHNAIGAYAPQSCVRYQNLTFFLSENGFYSFDGSQLNPIGNGKVDKFFLADLQRAQLFRITSTIDPNNKLVMWAYPSNNTLSGGNPDRILIYNWAFDKWALIDGLNIEILLQSLASGYTLESLDAISASLDALAWSLDSTQWTGGQLILSAFDSLHQLSKFNGLPMSAKLETGEFQLYPDMRAQLAEVRPNVVGVSASMTVSIINRNNLTESASVGAAGGYPNATGFVECLVDARYFRIRLETADGIDFLHLIGVEVNATESGYT